MRRGWELTKRSWQVLRSHPALMRFPVYGMLATLIPVIVLVLPGIYLVDTKEYAPGIALLAVGLYAASAFVFFFGVALAGAADAIFHGRDQGANVEGYRQRRHRRRRRPAGDTPRASADRRRDRPLGWRRQRRRCRARRGPVGI